MDFAERLQAMTIQMPAFILAVVFHEFAHGFIAKQWGDTTAQDLGRLTLNPVPHLDPVGTLLFPMINMATGIPILIGWARPVPIDPRRFRSFRPGLFFVSLAGPTMNFLLAIASAALFFGISLGVSRDFYLHEPLTQMALASVSLNFALGIFNLLPLPPLDGSKMVESVLPFHLARRYESLARYGFLILMGLLLLGAFRWLSIPIRYCTLYTLELMAGVFGVNLR